MFDAPEAAWAREEIAAAGGSVTAPEVFDLEVMNGLRRLVARGEVGEQAGSSAAADLLALRVIRWSHTPLARRIWSLRGQLTPYDAAYVALAELLEAPLVTTDSRLARSQGHSAQIRVFAG